MLGFLKLIARSFGFGRPRPRSSPPAEPVTADREISVKKQAPSAAEMLARLDDLPRAKVARVLDGDTVIVANAWGQTKIRLDSIDCPEDGQPWGNIAKAGLIKLVGGRTAVLEEHGQDSLGRTLATIYVRHEWQT